MRRSRGEATRSTSTRSSRVRLAKGRGEAGRSKAMNRTCRHADASACAARTRSLTAWKRPRPIQSSPSIGCAGQPAVNHAGATMRLPARLHNARPSQRARTPSSFSLTSQASTLMPAWKVLASIGPGIEAEGAGNDACIAASAPPGRAEGDSRSMASKAVRWSIAIIRGVRPAASPATTTATAGGRPGRRSGMPGVGARPAASPRRRPAPHWCRRRQTNCSLPPRRRRRVARLR